ncbi:MAG: hypothetical protein J6J15_05575 [Oscillospiraceae bacterium]|nr:hypothetical protein [Oscillospiraceae bacterium]
MDKLDILNRGAFVEQVINLLENISDNKVSTCFAIDGEWGTGKSFVLDMIEEQLNSLYSEKYFVVRYNSWKHDYYEEPLIAIVSTIIAEIEKKTALFSDEKEKQEIIGMLKAAGVSLLSLANTAIKAETGIDIKSAVETVIKGEKEGAEKYEKDHAYDTYLGLNKVIEKLSNLLQEIADEHTVVIIVDELDRCIPEYAIKVLERLHHLTEEKSNIITIIATDKKQLECSVKHLFGFAEGNKYLEKFINFEIKLDKGEVSEKITEKYADYVELFDKDIVFFDEPIEEYLQIIFKDIEPRTQEELMHRAMLIHKLLYTDKKDYSFMCVELLAIVMYYKYGYRAFVGTNKINVNSFDSIFVQYSNAAKPPFVEFFSKRFNQIKFDINRSSYANDSTVYTFPETLSLPSAILFTWYNVHNNKGGLIRFKYTWGGVYEPYKKNAEELKKFIEVLQIIK